MSWRPFGVDVGGRDLAGVRRWYASHGVEGFPVMRDGPGGCADDLHGELALRPRGPRGVGRGGTADRRFTSALRIDELLHDWPAAARALEGWGYRTGGGSLTPATFTEVRRFQADRLQRAGSLYLFAEMPPEFDYPGNTATARLLDGAVLPHCAETNRPLALLPGVRRAVSPALQDAGDTAERVSLAPYERLIGSHPRHKFLLTVLARENQHEVCVLARKFRNLHVFGCPWLADVPSLMEEAARLRVELLGLSMTPHHSNARVLEHLAPRWQDARRVVADVLKGKYLALAAAGWKVGEAEVARDAGALFGGAFEAFLQRSL